MDRLIWTAIKYSRYTQLRYIYTVGDFNIKFSTVTGFQNTKWSNLITDYNLTQLITHPTRVTKVSSSTIDHLYTNHSENVLEIVSSN